jgi:hypothetical protein
MGRSQTDPQGPGPGGQFESLGQPCPLREGVASTRVSSFVCFYLFWQLARFLLFIALVTLCRDLGVLAVCRGASTCPMMHRGGR